MTVVVFDLNDFYEKHGIHYSLLTHLDNIGLIKFNNLATFEQLRLPTTFTIQYFDNHFSIQLPNDVDSLITGHVLLTQAGMELATICDPTPDPEVCDYTIRSWNN